jgi:prevent-host-death family protein
MHTIREVGSFEAKTHLPQLLKDVMSGATIFITNRGVRVAKLSKADNEKLHSKEAIASLKLLREDIKWSGNMSTSKAMKQGRK